MMGTKERVFSPLPCNITLEDFVLENTFYRCLEKALDLSLTRNLVHLYDYVPGKADWFASGFPKEGRLASVPTIGQAARRDVPTCAPAEKVGAVRERLRKAGWDRCVVVNKDRVVLGLLRERELSSDPKSPVEEAMRNGPATFRPNEPVGKMAKRMQDRGATAVLVTTPDGGNLVGLVYREDAEQLAGART